MHAQRKVICPALGILRVRDRADTGRRAAAPFDRSLQGRCQPHAPAKARRNRSLACSCSSASVFHREAKPEIARRSAAGRFSARRMVARAQVGSTTCDTSAIACPSTGTATASPKKNGNEPITRSPATISPQIAMGTVSSDGSQGSAPRRPRPHRGREGAETKQR